MEHLFWSLVRALGRGRLTRVDDGGAVQLVQMQLSANETRDGTPRLAEYGFQSNPPAGSDALAVFLGGDRTNGVVIACGNQQYRFRNLAPGEVCISDDKGQSVHLSAAGIVVNGGGQPVTITNAPQITADAPLFHCTGDIEGDGNITCAGDMRDNSATNPHTAAASRAVYNSHHHPVPDVQRGSDIATSDIPQPQL
ncbi:phage baseplate assembly protein V [Paraburkholderia sp. HC6.4b]|uniref:phage baseplate assembly protein V n=1 Tax=unclassified Paraburkholderia TaxID=2615204 RepID=UPI00183AFF2A|nr:MULTISPECIES: phage baseplate assembly protein V [unclassified Paraburkholderia]MBB5411712.1 phage baseplate assembly protein V [Paraburkholderia sp. HC6.4b]MBB5453259.1 phage baseplate assembly protein V [Paraburkholderia sp. Kb1A]